MKLNQVTLPAADLSRSIAFYEKLGFVRVPVLAIKRKNAINEPLFTSPPETVEDLNPYARIIADEAMRRGIWVEVLDAEAQAIRRHGFGVVHHCHLPSGSRVCRCKRTCRANARRCPRPSATTFGT